jgi:hypothetical protein
MSHEHKLWLHVAIVIATWGLLFLGFRFGGLNLGKLRPWGAILGIASLGAWIVLLATESPYADFDMTFLLSFVVAVEWIAWFERRSAKRAM